MTSLTRSAVFQVSPDAVFRKKLVPKARYGTLWSFWIPHTITFGKIGSKNNVLRFSKTWNCILKTCIALKWEGDEKPRIFHGYWSALLKVNQTILKNAQKMKICHFPDLRFLRFSSSQKHKTTKNPQNSSLRTLLITYIQNRGNGNNYLNLVIN